MSIRSIGVSAAILVLAGATVGAAAPAKGKTAAAKPAPGAALDPAQVVAQLRKDETALRTARLTVRAVRKQGPVPAGAKGQAVWDAAGKLPTDSQRRESLIVSGASWKRDVTVLDEQGAPAAHFVAGVVRRNGRMLQESGHGDKKTASGVLGMDLGEDDHALLVTPGTDLLQGIKWKAAKRMGSQILLTGMQDTTPVTAALRTSPHYALERLSAEETLVTPQGKLQRGSLVRVSYDTTNGQLTPKTLERVDYATPPIGQLMFTSYTVESAQANTPVTDAELEIAFPSGIKIVDRRVDPPARYAQGDKDLTLDEVKALSQKQAANAAKVGAPAPGIELKTVAGDTAKLSDQKGKVVLLTFFASWCPPCNAEAPKMEKEIWQKYRERGLSVFGVDTAEREEPEKMAKQFVAEHGTTYPTLLDLEGDVAEAYRVEALPTIVLIDRTGTVRYIQAGFNEAEVVKQLETLLAEKQP